ncbi:MAG: ABC transporter ATP-binding protein [Thaumarchaeota archaeon]|nr:ABC transporter ATP-binding protein [Nitrososphaerota archaeon]
MTTPAIREREPPRLGEAVLEVGDLRMYYTTSAGEVKAVDGLNFSVKRGEVLGVVGESGCGKTSLALTIMKLLPSNGKIRSGRILIRGSDVVPMSDTEIRRKIRWSEVALIPQGAMNALNPIFKVGDQISEVIMAHSLTSRAEARKKTEELLVLVGIDPSRASHYPHEFSGGMKQRAMIAMSLALDPSLLIADEPTTALDVIVQAGIVRLLLDVKKRLGISIILISHDLALVAQMSEKVAIMYAGKFVEFGTSVDVYGLPLHPYTLGLLGAFADIRKPKEKLTAIPGSPPDLLDPPSGCRFRTRCKYAQELCATAEPPLEEALPGHLVACHFWKDIKENRAPINLGKWGEAKA